MSERSARKARTRERIRTRAGRLFRRRGYRGVGIDGIMAASQLTRGGFYCHFRSKADLFAEVLRAEPDFVRRLRTRRGRTPTALTREALAVVTDYLDPQNRDAVGSGCEMASLSVDVARAGDAAQAAFRAQLDALARELARGLPGAGPRDPRVLASVALCVGGLILARAANDDDLAPAAAAACRSQVAALLAPEQGGGAPAPRAPSARARR